jgi:hypothetical protein
MRIGSDDGRVETTPPIVTWDRSFKTYLGWWSLGMQDRNSAVDSIVLEPRHKFFSRGVITMIFCHYEAAL